MSFQHPRTSINPYWCQYHWAPYILAPVPAQNRANAYVPQQLWTLRTYKDAVRDKLKTIGRVSNVPQLVVIDWTTAQQKSMCCILGDPTMDRILARILRELGLRL